VTRKYGAIDRYVEASEPDAQRPRRSPCDQRHPDIFPSSLGDIPDGPGRRGEVRIGDVTDLAAGQRAMHRRRTWAAVAIIGFVAALLPMVYLHLEAGGQLSPLRHTISDYVFAHQGTKLFDSSALSLAIGSASLTTGLANAGLVRGLPLTALFLVWCAGLTIAVLFPTDPVGGVQSLSGAIHRWAAIMFFPCLPMAGFLLAKRCQVTPGWEHRAGTVLRLSVLSTIVLAVFALIQLSINRPDLMPFEHVLRNYLGLAERIAFGVDMALLFVLGATLWRWAPAKGAPPRVPACPQETGSDPVGGGAR